MRLRRKLNKGFTLVELIVVIAIIAILAAVSAVSYIAFINQANKSADEQTVTQVNLALQAAEVNGKCATPTEAVEVAYENGFVIEKLTPTSQGYSYAWNSVTNRFNIIEKDKVVYPADYGSAKTYELYKFVSTIEDGNVYSLYLKSDFQGELPGTINYGIDCGDHLFESINYKNTGSAQEVIIRTIGGSLSIDAEHDVVKHYGVLENVDIKAVAMNSYDEYGSIFGVLKVAKGSIKLNGNAEVGTIALSGDISGIKIKENDESIVYSIVSTYANLTGNEENIQVSNKSEVITTTKVETTSLTNVLFGGGNGTNTNPYKLYSTGHFVQFSEYVNSGRFTEYVYTKLASNIDISGLGWNPIGNAEHPFFGSFNGQKTDGSTESYTINGLTNNGYVPSYKLFGTTNAAHNYGMAYGLFGVIGTLDNKLDSGVVEISNLNFTNVDINIDVANMLGVLVGCDAAAAKIGSSYVNGSYSRDLKVENVIVSGKIISTNGNGVTVGGILGKIYSKGLVEVISCTNNCIIDVIGNSKGAGIVGFISGSKGVKINGCKNNATLKISESGGTPNYFGGIFTCGTNNNTFTLEATNNINNGDLYNSGTNNFYIGSLSTFPDSKDTAISGNINNGKTFGLSEKTFVEKTSYCFGNNGGSKKMNGDGSIVN